MLRDRAPITAEARGIWLGSASPRRRELLAQVGLEPWVRVSDVAEVRGPGERPADYALRLAQEKGRAARAAVGATWKAGEPSWIVAADTIVVQGETTLEKPGSPEEAERMLGRLSGQAHEVITAFWVGDVQGAASRSQAVTAKVVFRELTAAEIRGYVATQEPMDKAGAYGIQGIGGAFVSRIEGSYTAIVGLPVQAVVAALIEQGALVGFPWGPR